MHLLIAYFGAILGSFLFCMFSHRNSFDWLLKNRSTCDHCHHTLGIYDLWPVISYITNQGKCRYCRFPISIHYFYTELFAGILFLILFDLNHPLFSVSLFSIFFFMVCYDFAQRWVPDSLFLIFFILGLFYNQQYHVISYSDLIILLLILIGLFSFFHQFIGGADIKFIFISCLFLPITSFPLFIFLAASSGLLYAFLNKMRIIPFIPFLILSFIILWQL
ncbi:prepilin peptidase [Facklamia hominis]|uniref:prepilin peptidase n=1 Tax=Facklamia hominis TaxID=178214 RepID=UPI0029D40FFF|nr:prepilin peptidase [Facklamia hominis]WPJ90802.1 prepilin peptidase [Facklamia hominis]